MRSRRGTLLLLVLLAAVVNLPLAHSTWLEGRVARDGVDVRAEVVEQRVLGPDDDPAHVVVLVLPADVDPAQTPYRVVVDRHTYDAAGAAGALEVRVLPDRPSAYAVPGEVTSRVALWVTLLADLALLGLVLLVWRFGGGRRGPAVRRLVAVADVERARPGSRLEQDGDLWTVCGEVVEKGPDRLVLDVDGERVEVGLAGHANPVGHQQPALVRARAADEQP